MNDDAHANFVREFLSRAATRLTRLSVLQGLAMGVAIASALSLLGVPARGSQLAAFAVAGVCAAFGVAVRLVSTCAARSDPARMIEARAPQFRNVLITADELRPSAGGLAPDFARPGALAATPDSVHDLVQRKASRIARTVDITSLFPARRTVVTAIVSAAAFGVVSARDVPAVRTVVHAVRRAAGVAAGTTSPTIDDVVITVLSPSYSGRAAVTLRNVPRIAALSGSRIQLKMVASADSLLVQTLHSSQWLHPAGGDAFRLELPADVDDFIALTPASAAGRNGSRRLIGVSVVADASPRVRIVAPGRDLMLRDSRQIIELGLEADDDIGLASLRLRYTKVSGSGERYSFTEGEVPLMVTRHTVRDWKAKARWTLDSLTLSPGDMVVYRAIAADARPGSLPQESDAFIAEVIAPGGEAAPGFAIDPEQERYAVSQQMVILKTERLIARRTSMAVDSTAVAAMELAAEQRKVRAEFVFMMGGEVADAPDATATSTDLNEEAEAEGEADIAAGRLANLGRMSLMRAIRHMSLAASALTTASLSDALVAEKAALKQLEQAFSRTRILLRALSEHERLDMTRRLTGVLTDVRSTSQPSIVPPANARTDAIRRAVAAIAALVGERARADVDQAGVVQRRAARASELAESLLRIDPAFAPFQRASSRLSDASTAFTLGQDVRAMAQLDSAVLVLAIVLRTDTPVATSAVSAPKASLLGGALVDAAKVPASEPARRAARPR